jgi:3-methyl-2-oxobutanoate hydroxymethyltransferase
MSQQSSPSQASPIIESNPPYGQIQRHAGEGRKPVTIRQLADMRARGEKIAVLTAYDATFAATADQAGVDCIMVGDSLGMVCQGRSSTVGVSLESMLYHTQCVAQGLQRADGRALIIADLPFGTYQQSRDRAIESAIQLMQAGAQMVKLEGGGWTTEIVGFLVERIPVCGHLGLTPQTVSALGGYRVQGREAETAAVIQADAAALDEAGAVMMVLEMIPATLAANITASMSQCATIGIGAGNGTAGQVLVMHDMLGLNLGRMARFVRNFMQDSGGIQAAFAAYVSAVKNCTFPDNSLHAW